MGRIVNSVIDADKRDEALKAQRFAMLQDIARDLSGEISFPTCFDVAIRIRNALRDPLVSIRQVSRLISTEPLVTAKLLRLANSAAQHTGGRAITDVESAIVRLGIEAARSAALSVAMEQLLRSKDLAVFAELAKELWVHAIKSAAAARVLARNFTRINPDEAMTAGLVHDLGAFYMLYRAAQYEELRIRPNTVKYLIIQWHESIGESLMAALGLPEQIVDAVRDHDQPRDEVTEPVTLSDIVYVANQLGGGMWEWVRQSAGEVLEPPEISNPVYLALADEIDAEYLELCGVLS
jgi:HD-like signal output (HDOD) protein